MNNRKLVLTELIHNVQDFWLLQTTIMVFHQYPTADEFIAFVRGIPTRGKMWNPTFNRHVPKRDLDLCAQLWHRIGHTWRRWIWTEAELATLYDHFVANGLD